jgi:hypothetical protein
MAKIEQEALKYGISKERLFLLLSTETLYPYISLEDAIKELKRLKEIDEYKKG